VTDPGAIVAQAQTGEIALFWVSAVVAVGAAIAMVTLRNVVHGALMLVLNLMAVAGLFLALESPFLAVTQIIVYGGAIMVLFLFVIMLLGVRRDDLLVAREGLVKGGAWLVGVLFAGAFLLVIIGPYTGAASVCGAATGDAFVADGIPCAGLAEIFEDRDGSVVFAARSLFTRYIFAFEFVALILVVATIAALLIGRRSDIPDDVGGTAAAAGGPGSDLRGGRATTEAASPHHHEDPGDPTAVSDRGEA
jgi:NADH-quinone oxidoreductase subunit J